MSDELNSLKAKKIDELRKQKMLQERQDRMIADMKKQATTPVIKDSSLSTQDTHHIKSTSAPVDTKGISKISSGAEFTDKIAKLRALKAAGKKVAGIIPLAGVGMAMMDSPAASASEMIQDPNVQRAALSEIAGPVGDAIDIGGDLAEYGLDKLGEKRDLDLIESSEERARKSYQKSPARLDRLRRLMQGEE